MWETIFVFLFTRALRWLAFIKLSLEHYDTSVYDYYTPTYAMNPNHITIPNHNISTTMKPQIYYIEDITKDNKVFKEVQEFIKKSIPLIFKTKQNKPIFADYENFELNSPLNESELENKTYIVVDSWYNYGNDDFIEFGRKLLNFQYLTFPGIIVKLYGPYVHSRTHIDASAFFGYNLYYIQKGKKRVIIIPKENSKYMDFDMVTIPIDGIFVKQEIESRSTDPDNLDWLKNIPFYYDFTLNKNEILFWPSGQLPHRFINLEKNNVIYSTRFWCDDNVNPLVYKRIMLRADHIGKEAIKRYKEPREILIMD